MWMSKLRIAPPPSPAPLRHYIASALTLVIVLSAGALGVQIFGDPAGVTPRKIVSLHTGASSEPLRAPLSEVIIDPSIDGEAGAELDLPLAPEEAMAAAGLEQAPPPTPPLPKAPIRGLTQPGPLGPLPIIGPDGRTPFQAYKRPFIADPKKPKIAIIVGGLGFGARATQQAIDELPAAVTLAFVPYADNVQTWIDRARADGHETMLEIPMEPFDPEAVDTGPQTLLVNAQPRENVARLENLMSRATGYFGIANYQGGRFAASTQASEPIVRALNERGLAIVGAGISPRVGLAAEAGRQGARFAVADRILDIRREAEAIDEQLLTLEALALENGHALGSGFAYPLTITQVAAWARGVEGRGYQLAPASAMVETRSAR